MRSFSSRGASDTNRSGGIHGMSRWQSAEILRYCTIILRSTKDRIDCTPSAAGSPSAQGCAYSAFLPIRHEPDASLLWLLSWACACTRNTLDYMRHQLQVVYMASHCCLRPSHPPAPAGDRPSPGQSASSGSADL